MVLAKLNSILKLILLLLILPCCGHFEVSLKVYGLTGGRMGAGNVTTIASYNTFTEEVTLLNINKYEHIIKELRKQFFPNNAIDPKINDSKKFNIIEFRRMCGFINKKECK